ncbi:uncharacterized protein LOC6566524 [Drosophila grimshawi]|uniref:GH13500 n=1 Tax=Drosophila grimshawi TaxID=7222 RepID=B4JPD5_DROGR|nr:uncharacterized protein LOC6566524 [Drosophila grimshawi]EDV98765.1 GH13500 [Drosophila grimshawi]
MATSVLQGCSSSALRDVCESTNLLDYVESVVDRIKSTNSSIGTKTRLLVDPSAAMIYFGFCAVISHILLAGITVIIVRKCLALKMVHTAGHAFYCTVAFVFCLGEALLVRHSRVLELWLGIFNLDLLHSAFGLLAFGIGVGGVAIKTLQKLERKREEPTATVKHFRSNHGFFGIVGCVLLLGSVLSGLPLYFYTFKWLQLVHRFCSLGSFATLMASQMFSYNTGFAQRQWKARHVRLFKLFTFIVTITTINYEFRRFTREIVALIARQFGD